MTTQVPGESDANRVGMDAGRKKRIGIAKPAAKSVCIQLPLNQFTYDYVQPQDNGNRSDVRNFTLLDGAGNGLRVTGLQPFKFRGLAVCGGGFGARASSV